MNGKILLDTSIVIPYLNNDPHVRQRIAATSQVFVPFTVIGELFYGAYKSAKSAENVQRVETFAADNIILPSNPQVSKSYGKIKSDLLAKGKPLPENDIWIAAVALGFGLTLVTRDAHFSLIEGLSIEEW